MGEARVGWWERERERVLKRERVEFRWARREALVGGGAKVGIWIAKDAFEGLRTWALGGGVRSVLVERKAVWRCRCRRRVRRDARRESKM